MPATDVQWSHACNVMIENNNAFDCRNFRALMPEMVHFRGFAHPRPCRTGPGPTVQNIVYERFSIRGRQDGRRWCGGDL
jgi:hypothetical protein